MMRALNNMPYAQAKVFIRDNGDQILVSYKTTVAGIEDGYLWCNGTYSATTRRHLGAYAKELGLTYQVMKWLYEHDSKLNLATGEVIPL